MLSGPIEPSSNTSLFFPGLFFFFVQALAFVSFAFRAIMP
jgi:hypothetical protein